MKTFRKTLAILLSLCMMFGLFVFTPLTASAEEGIHAAPHRFDLYDYFTAYKSAYDAGTPFVNNTPWAMQTRKVGTDTWISDMSVADATVDPNFLYIRPDYESTWAYTAGFAFRTYVSPGDGRYMNAVAIPAYLSTNTDFHYDTAYAFTAPIHGIYSVGLANQKLVASFDECNGYHKMSNDEPLDFGVRITVDGETVWPTAETANYYNGYVRFGDKEATVSYLNLPTVNNIELNKDSVLRIEITQFTPAGNAWTQRILGTPSVTYDRKIFTRDVPTAFPVTYELYDYFNAYIDDKDSDTPWSAEVLINQDWLPMNHVGLDGDYRLLCNENHEWGGNWPGVKVYRPESAITTPGTRYYFAFMTPCNHENLANANVSYKFVVPYDGYYTFGKCSRDLCYSFAEMDVFSVPQHLPNADYGVRITVDGEKIWPENDDWVHLGSKVGVYSVDIPQLKLRLMENQVLRVETAAFEDQAYPWDNTISGLPSMTLNKLYIERPVPTQDSLPQTYEVYDFYNNILDGKSNTSPWEVAIARGTEWYTVDTVGNDSDPSYFYLHNRMYEWGGNWPGAKIYRPAAAQTSGERYYYAFLTPCNSGSLDNTYASYAFTTPFTGNYHFGKCDRDLCVSYADMDYFGANEGVANGDFGVRITIDGKKIWPENQDWVHIGSAVDTCKVEIPELDLFLKEDQILRVETADFTGQEWPWYNNISGLPAMTLTDIEGVGTCKTREFEDAGFYSDDLGGAVNTMFDLYDGERIYTKYAATKDSDGVRMQLEPTVWGNGVKMTLNGFEVLLKGENSTITSPSGIVEPIQINDNTIYDIVFEVLPAFAENKITGTLVALTVNGISIEKFFAGESTTGAAAEGLCLENATGDVVNVMASDLSVKSGSGLLYIPESRVLYVETLDQANIAAGIENGERYTFAGQVVTGSKLFRNGNDAEQMTYTFAVGGDVNSDGVQNIKDLIRLKKAAADQVAYTDAMKIAANFGSLGTGIAETLVGFRIDLLNR